MKGEEYRVRRIINKFFYLQSRIDRLGIYIEGMEDFLYSLLDEDYEVFRRKIDVIEVYNYFRKLHHKIENVLRRIEELESGSKVQEKIRKKDVEIVEE